MSIKPNQDYGPLTDLIGEWKGESGRDIAPEPDGTETNDYYETMTFSPVGEVTNAEEQPLMALHYRQIVHRKGDNKLIHDQTGYWLWNEQSGEVTHSFTLPRGMTVLAVGKVIQSKAEAVMVELQAQEGASVGNIAQSPFLQTKARTKSFQQSVTLSADKLEYSQTTVLDIYGREFQHTDANVLEHV